jgi:hypothetical protein
MKYQYKGEMYMSNIKGYIYIHKNKINNLCYIGQTNNPKKRFKYEGIYYKDSPKFWNAIQKYGLNNFEHIVLPTIYTTQQELDQAEIDMIKELDSYNNGYNLTEGGKYIKRTPEMIKKFSEKRKGHIVTKETREKLSKKIKGVRQSSKWKKINQYDLEGVFIKTFKSREDIKEELGFKHLTNISKVCNGKHKTAYGYIWKYNEEKMI